MPFTAQQLVNFPISNARFQQVTGFANDTIAAAMQQNRMFIVDFSRYASYCAVLPSYINCKLFPAKALFCVLPDGSGTLKTIAIQSTPTPAKSQADITNWKNSGASELTRPSLYLTPADDYWSWQMAKNTWTTMACMADVINHLGIHLFIEPLAVCCYRNFAHAHPLFSLLGPHTMDLVVNDTTGTVSGTKITIGNGTVSTGNFVGGVHAGFLPTFLGRVTGWTDVSFIEAAVQRHSEYNFTTHGYSNAAQKRAPLSTIADVPVLDDDQSWSVLYPWVSNYLALYYTSDADVQNDWELQNFVNDVINTAKIPGFPSSIQNRSALYAMVAELIYFFCCNHAFGDLSCFIPLGSLGYFNNTDPPVPNPAVPLTQANWFTCMPPINVALAQYVNARIFIQLPQPWYESFAKYPYGNFLHDSRIAPLLKTFQNNANTLDIALRKKAKARQWFYQVRLPSNTSMSPWK